VIGWLITGAALAGLGAYARWVEPSWLDVSETEIPLRGLDAAFDGYRIAFLSDLHWGPRKRLAWLERIVDRVNALAPDLIAIGGDIIQFRARNIAEGMAILDRLRAPDGVWCVLGNHDFRRRGIGPLRIRRELANTAIRELWNEAVPIRRGDVAFWLAGVGDFWRDVCDVYGALQGVPPDEPRIVLSHNPDGYLQIGGTRVDLMLSGHTHGGQVRLPFIGPVITRTASGRTLGAGLQQVGETQIYTSRGVSHGDLPVRLFCRPELPVILLRKA